MPRFSNWREDFVANESSNSMVLEVITDTKMTDKKDAKKVKEKNINNAKLIKINPTFKEAIEEIGGELLEVKEIDNKKEDEKEDEKEDSSAKQLKNKEKRVAMMKRQILMRKMMAVKQGAGADIVASYEPDIEGAIEYFYEEGINEEGIDQLIEEIGLEAFVDFVEGGSVELNEERAARKASVRAKKYDVVKKEVDKADAARKKAKKGEYAPSYAKKETDVTVYDDKPSAKKKAPAKKTVAKKAAPKPAPKKAEPKPVAVKKTTTKKTTTKKVVKAVAKVKKTQPVKKATKQGLGDKIRSAYKAGVKRHRKATQGARVFGKGFTAGAKKAVKFAKDVKKVVSEANRGEKEVDASNLKKVGRRNINRFETGTVKRTESSGGRKPTYKTVTLANPKPGYGKKSDHYKKNKLSAPSLGRHGTSSEPEKGPQKHHTQGVEYHDAAQKQRRQEHKSRRGVKTKGTVAADIKKSLKREGYQRDPEQSKKDRTHSSQPDPSKDGFTGIGNMSIKDIMKMNSKIKARESKKTKKEEVEVQESSAVFSIGKRANAAIVDDKRKKKLEYLKKLTKAVRRKDYHPYLHDPKESKVEGEMVEGASWGLWKGDGKDKIRGDGGKTSMKDRPKKYPYGKATKENPRGKRDQAELDRAQAYIKKNPNFGKVSEAKVDKGRSDYGKATIRNWRHSGPSTVEPAMFDPENKRGKTIDKRREEHKARRGVKGAKVPTYKKESFSDWRIDLGEEGYDRWRDDRLVKYGIGYDGSDRKGPSPRPTGKQPKGDTVYQAKMRKKYGGKLPSAIQVVKDKYKGQIYDGKKKG